MKKAENRSVIRSLVTGILMLGMTLGMSACSQTGVNNDRAQQVYSNRAQVREAPAAQTNAASKAHSAGYTEKSRSEFMAGCRQSCASKDKTKTTAAFCEMYCDCTHAGLRMKVPYADLQTLSEGKKPTSIDTIVNIQNQCLKDAASSQVKKGS